MDFYPRSPCGERRPKLPANRKGKKISIHALLAESDFTTVLHWYHINNFYPRSPCGERRASQSYSFIIIRFLSTLSLRRATSSLDDILAGVNISIHALLAESDYQILDDMSGATISIHALLAESDTPRALRHCTTYLFLSTLSLRRATQNTQT